MALNAITRVPIRQRLKEIGHTQKRRQCEDGGRNWSDVGCLRPPEDEGGMEWNLPQSLGGSMALLTPLTSGLLNCERISFSDFKPPSCDHFLQQLQETNINRIRPETAKTLMIRQPQRLLIPLYFSYASALLFLILVLLFFSMEFFSSI